MKKRKTINEPQLWKVNGLYLIPLSAQQYAVTEYHKIKQMYPDIKVCFLKDATCPIQAILSELLHPSEFKDKDSCYEIVAARLIDKTHTTIKMGKYTVTWVDDHAECLGSRICNKCFIEGRLYPHTCPVHLHCSHGKKRVRSCDSCVATTLQGYWQERTLCYQGEQEELFAISRCSSKKQSFKCLECKHVFEKSVTLTTSNGGGWCPFCAHHQLCENITCNFCWSNSFASVEKSKHWDYIQNLRTPRQVFKSCNLKFWFCCEVCLHKFESPLNGISGSRNSWCPFCANKKICDDCQCTPCYNKSFASHDKSQYWDINKNQISPRNVFRYSYKKYWFKCELCSHDFNVEPNMVMQGCWCPFCAHKQLCFDSACQHCYSNSFASGKESQFWHLTKNGMLKPRDIFKRSHESYWFYCDVCSHDFQSVPNCISRNNWCPFCAHQQLCLNMLCENCYENSFASSKQSQFWHPTKNNILKPRNIFKQSNKKYWFYCDVCAHDFQSVPGNITRNIWCPFCAHQQLCVDPKCQNCSNNSFASIEKSNHWHVTKNALVIPRQVFKQSRKKYWFHCDVCSHDFQSALCQVTNDQWCHFCSGHQRCDQPTCTTCAQSCDVCKSKKAQTKTRVSRTWVCWSCLDDALLRDPDEAPLQQRAKVSLEILVLSELQRSAILQGHYFISEPTSWDCAVLPGLNFKPDCMWCFDENEDIIYLGNVSKLNLNEIKYACHLEILEDSQAAHSKARSVSDEDREIDIRNLYGSQQIPMGCLYATVAHKKHFNAHPDDVFFIKVGEEYQVIPERADAWAVRIQQICATLVKMVQDKSNATIHIGH